MIVLVTGGTGTLGSHLIPLLLGDPTIDRIRILSRGEHKQIEMEEKLQGERVDFFMGDVRDRERCERACHGADVIYHLAATKSVDKCEYDPLEAIATNITGTRNMVAAAIKWGVKKFIFTSTDKAVSPLNIYGASKLCAEKLVIQANVGDHKTRFAVARYGNVMGSQGSVLPKWIRALKRQETLKVMRADMTRFFITPNEAAQFVTGIAATMSGGEIFIPAMKSTTIGLLMDAIGTLLGVPVQWEEMGIRPGEKIHESLVGSDEVPLTTFVRASTLGTHFLRWPESKLFPFEVRGEPAKKFGFIHPHKGYTSEVAQRFEQGELCRMIQQSTGSKLWRKSEAHTWDAKTLPKS